jgi:Cu/Ag efflux pump CusA
MGRETARGVDRLPGQTGRLFRPLAHANTFVMLVAALLSIMFVPELRDWSEPHQVGRQASELCTIGLT